MADLLDAEKALKMSMQNKERIRLGLYNKYTRKSNLHFELCIREINDAIKKGKTQVKIELIDGILSNEHIEMFKEKGYKITQSYCQELLYYDMLVESIIIIKWN